MFIRIMALIATMAVASVCSAQKSEVLHINGAQGMLYAELEKPDVPSQGRLPLVIICHGFGGNCNSSLLTGIADNLYKEGIASLRFDFNGHGQSEGQFQNMTVPNEIEDLKCVISWAEAQPWVKELSLVGHSQGGVVTSMTAGELGDNIIKSLVLMAPAAVLRDDALRGNTMGAVYEFWDLKEDYVQLPFGLKLGRAYIESAIKLPIYETALRYTGPVLVIHGERDRVVPYTYGERYHTGYLNSSFRLIPGEDHGFSRTSSETSLLAADWLAKQLK